MKLITASVKIKVMERERKVLTEGISDVKSFGGSPMVVEVSFVRWRQAPTYTIANFEFLGSCCNWSVVCGNREDHNNGEEGGGEERSRSHSCVLHHLFMFIPRIG